MLFRQNAGADQAARPAEEHLPLPQDRAQAGFLPPGTRAERAPAGQPAPVAGRQPAATAGQESGNVLIVGDGIRLKGEITACDRLVVEGHVEVSLNETRAVEIRPTGRFIGSCEVEEAEISGVYEGELAVRERLCVRSTGRVTGKITYGEIELERGGQIAGDLAVRASGEALATRMTEALKGQKGTVPSPGRKVA